MIFAIINNDTRTWNMGGNMREREKLLFKSHICSILLFVCLAVVWFEFRPICFWGRRSITWTVSPPLLGLFIYFWIRFPLSLSKAGLEPLISYLCNWHYSCTPPWPAHPLFVELYLYYSLHIVCCTLLAWESDQDGLI
jgi:hypothetical protein